MKNIHVLPTDKPSRLRYNLSNILVLTKEAYRDYRKQVNQNIYITSDEEVKEGDWFIHISYDSTSIQKAIEISNHILDNQGMISNKENNSKIILTTDQDLIKDGVQPIEDGFVEWFVKNPSCEYVKVNYEIYKEGVGLLTSDWRMSEDDKYKIIIPKEEPKQETIEEAAEKFYPPKTTDLICSPKLVRDSFIAGAKWQQEQDKNKYSEEEVLDILVSSQT